MSKRGLFLWAVAAVLVAAPSLDGPIRAAESEVTASLAVGHDDNPARVSVPDAPSGMFADQRVQATFRFRPQQRTRAFLNLSARQRSHESGASDADTARASVRGGWLFTPVLQRNRSFIIRVGAEARLYDATFVDPATGEIYRYDPQGNGPGEPVPDRFDYRSGEAFADFRWKVNRNVRLRLDTALEQRDYSEDYASIGLDALDHDALSIEPGIRFRAGRAVTIDLSMPATFRSYDERPALDGNGSAVSGVQREYEYRGYNLSLTVQPTRSLKLRADARRLDRTDEYAGYYDSASETVYVWMEQQLGSRAGLELYAARTSYDYDNAVVPDDPRSVLRGGDFDTVLGRFEHSFGKQRRQGLQIFAEIGSQNADNQDPTLAYDRQWALGGIRYRSK